MQTFSHGNKGANFVLSVYRIPETHVAACRVLDRHHCVPISYGHTVRVDPVCPLPRDAVPCVRGGCGSCVVMSRDDKV